MPQTKRQHFWKGSNSVNLVLCFNSGPGGGFRMKYCYFKNTRKLVLREALLLQVYLEFIRNELNYSGQEAKKYNLQSMLLNTPVTLKQVKAIKPGINQ